MFHLLLSLIPIPTPRSASGIGLLMVIVGVYAILSIQIQDDAAIYTHRLLAGGAAILIGLGLLAYEVCRRTKDEDNKEDGGA